MNLMSEIKKYEYALKFLFVIVGLLLFYKSYDFGWGFIIAGIVSKENIYWGMQDKGHSMIILALIVLFVPAIAIYFLISPLSAGGYLLATLLYFAIRYAIRLWLTHRQSE